MTGARLRAEGLRVDLGRRTVINDVSVRAAPGEVIGIVGPNGSGKSTLLRALAGILPFSAGSIHIDDIDITHLPARRLAQTTAAVLQDSVGDFDLEVRDVVAMGRAPFKRMFQRDNMSDTRVVARALDLVDASALACRPFALMSGGERQRVLIARALAQQPRLLILDEPINHLDIRHQFDVLALSAKLGITAVIALHDLNLAAHYCNRLHVLQHGREISCGTPQQVLTTDLIAAVYDVTADITPHPHSGRPTAQFRY